MTTAHRPTFHAAIGGAEQGGGRYIAGVSRTHVHDLPGQLKLKTRVPGQGTAAEIRARDLRAELEEREEKHFKAIGKPSFSSARALPPPPPADDDDDDDQALIMDPEDADDKPNTRHAAAPPVDSDDDDDDDETEELMRELERIKKERAQEAARKEREEAEMAAKEKDSAILQGNPPLDPTRTGANASGNFQVKRRWDDDVVFKNQSREPKKEARRFINDTVRNDFHRKFLSRYIK